MRITWLGHATVLIELDGVTLLTDPVLRRTVLHLRRAGQVPVAAVGSPDAVLISHLHWDHLDLPSLDRLGRHTLSSCPPVRASSCGGAGSSRSTRCRRGWRQRSGS